MKKRNLVWLGACAALALLIHAWAADQEVRSVQKGVKEGHNGTVKWGRMLIAGESYNMQIGRAHV